MTGSPGPPWRTGLWSALALLLLVGVVVVLAGDGDRPPATAPPAADSPTGGTPAPGSPNRPTAGSAVEAASVLAGGQPDGAAAERAAGTPGGDGWEPIPAPPDQVGWASALAPSSSAPLETPRRGGVQSAETTPKTPSPVAAAQVSIDLVDATGAVAEQTVSVGGSPVSLAVVDEARPVVSVVEAPSLTVDVLPSRDAILAGFDSVAFTVRTDGVTPSDRAADLSAAEADALAAGTAVAVSVDYSSLVDEFGADWAGRLRLVRFAPCALRRATSGCPRAEVVAGFVNDPSTSTITAEIPLADLAAPSEPPAAAAPAEGSVTGFALAAGASSSTGNYTATSLNPQGTWAVGAQSGEFTWSSPIDAPAPPAGDAPQVHVSYASAAIDGLTSDQNTQGGVLGPGWSLNEGFIERSYRPCVADSGATGDFCWFSDNATFSFAGMSERLVRTGTIAAPVGGWLLDEYRMEEHDGWLVRRHYRTASSGRGGVGVDDNGEYWQVTAPDGTAYWFGYGTESGDYAPSTALGSLLTVPVVGNHPAEPCNAQSYSWCHQGYRWMLDRIEDTNGRVTTFAYAQDHNFYGVRSTPGWSEPYVAGAVLARVEYGQLVGSAVTPDWHTNAISFNYHYRCNNPVGGVCAAAPTTATAASFPDVPVDQFCLDAYCTKYSPTFYTTRMLRSIDVQARTASGAMATSASDLFGLEWVDADGAGADPPRLWLRTIQHQGLLPTAVTMPAIRFDSSSVLANRVDYSTSLGVSQMRYFRVDTIRDEYGAQLAVYYTQPKPCPSPWPSSTPPGWTGFQDNSWSCFARWWVPPSGPARSP